jgi:hypothetical protein
MTNYTPPRSGQDLNHFMASPQLTMPHYANNDSVNYNYSPHPHYENVSPTYTTYANSFISSQTQSQGAHYISDNLQMAAQYPYGPPVLSNPASHRALAQTTPYSFQQLSQHPCPHSPRYSNGHDVYQLLDVESQESVNENTMLSEPVLPPLDGFPEIKDFDRLINR